jgi:hypothetical protein
MHIDVVGCVVNTGSTYYVTSVDGGIELVVTGSVFQHVNGISLVAYDRRMDPN